jgi:hypothetical protein
MVKVVMFDYTIYYYEKTDIIFRTCSMQHFTFLSEK